MISACKFCGQVISLDCDCENEQEAEELAVMQCKCYAAQDYQRRKQQAQKAKSELQDMLSNDDPVHNIKACDAEVIEIFEKAIDLISENKLHKISAGICSGGSVDIKCGSNGKISIQRSVTLRQKHEAE